jgi:hypothetical protein
MLTLEEPINDLLAVPARVRVDVPLPVTANALKPNCVPPFVAGSELLQSPGHCGCLVIDRLPPPTLVIVIDTGNELFVGPNLKLGAKPVNEEVVDVAKELEELPLKVMLGVPDI